MKRDLTRTPKLSTQEYRRRLSEQGGACAICSSRPTRRRLAIDHDHETGLVRGLLCTNCNLGLGNFADDPALLDKAASYLRANNCPSGSNRTALLEPLVLDAARSIVSAERTRIIRGRHRGRVKDPERWRQWAVGRVEQNLGYILRKVATVVRVVHPSWSCSGIARIIVEQGKAAVNAGDCPRTDDDPSWTRRRTAAVATVIREEMGKLEVQLAVS